MTPQEAHDGLGTLQLLDVREDEELAAARVAGAIHIPMHSIPDRIDELDRDRPVAVLCHVGQRSAHVAEYLRQAGFDARNVEGGLQRWVRDGLPLQS